MRPRHSLPLSEREFLILRELIRERTGLFYDDGKQEILADRLSRRVVERGLDAFIDYYYLLKYGESDDEWPHVFDALSVPETYFWREFDQIRVLVEHVVPTHFANPAAAPLRIWSAACANGEEPLTIAMALNEAGWLRRAPIEIVASDGSGHALTLAQRGIFRERSFRSLPAEFRRKYFHPEGPDWRIDSRIHSQIRWERINLASAAEIRKMLPANVIFCRNVFIYFSADAVRKTVRCFAEGIRRPGYLFVGVAESLLRTTDDFELQEIGGAYVYFPR